MSREPTDAELARLLSGRVGPSVQDKERIFEAVFKQITPPRRTWQIFAGVLATAAALTLGVFAASSPPQPEFGVRGSATENVGLRCVQGGQPSDCRSGSTLTFQLTVDDKPFFAAFARTSDGSVIWYLPSIGARSARDVGGQGFVLGAAEPLEVFGLFTDRAMTRDELKQELAGQLQSTDHLSVVRRTLGVLPRSSL